MNKHDADKIITEYVQKLYGFALNKLGNPDEAEELSARIAAEVYDVLVKRENIVNVNGYIYKIAENVWARYAAAKNKSRSFESINGYDGEAGCFDNIPCDSDFTEELQRSEQYGIIRREIAYLSKVQREIVVRHYYRCEKIRSIAASMGIPEGTVKWHLSCTRKELMANMERIRTIVSLGIQPIHLTDMGHDGCVGTKGDTADFLAKTITQNIAYAAYHKPRTVNEIAEELGINPVFVEEETDILEKYGFMDKPEDGRYRTNIYIRIPNSEADKIYSELVKKYTEEFAEKFFIPYLKSVREIPDFLTVPDNDLNLLKWCMIPSLSEKLDVSDTDGDIYSVKRIDGGDYIAFAALDVPSEKNDSDGLYSCCGPMWRIQRGSNDNSFLWRSLRTEVYWGSKDGWRENLSGDYETLYRFINGELAENDTNLYAYKRLFERGYLVRKNSQPKVNIILSQSLDKWSGLFPETSGEVLALAKEYAEKTAKADMIGQPKHMHGLIRYYSGNAACNLFTHVMKYLLDKGELQLPSEEQRRGLCTVMFLNK